MFRFLDPNNHKCLYKFVFRHYSKTEFSSSTIAPGKSGNKKLKFREKYKGTMLPNASNFIARSQISMFPF